MKIMFLNFTFKPNELFGQPSIQPHKNFLFCTIYIYLHTYLFVDK